MSDKIIGYKNPPLGKRWKKGQSGNPKGRPKLLSTYKNPKQSLTYKQWRYRVDYLSKKTLSHENPNLFKLYKSKIYGSEKKSMNSCLSIDHILPARFCYDMGMPPIACANIHNIRIVSMKKNHEFRIKWTKIMNSGLKDFINER
tara:strand:- start:159 stop:590 length:432 start_codon:yes stop_codon:yes gene_type:complete